MHLVTQEIAGSSPVASIAPFFMVDGYQPWVSLCTERRLEVGQGVSPADSGSQPDTSIPPCPYGLDKG